MTLKASDGAAHRTACRNVACAIKFDHRLPEMAFSGIWSHFLFFQSDWMFTPEFTEVASEFLGLENAGICCLLNLDETRSIEFGEIAAIFLDRTTTGKEYIARLRGGGPAVGWLYGMDRYACASDIGDWSIYCEKQNDIAVLGLRNSHAVTKFAAPLRKLRARTIEALCQSGHDAVFPFNKLTAAWRKPPTANYAKLDQ